MITRFRFAPIALFALVPLACDDTKASEGVAESQPPTSSESAEGSLADGPLEPYRRELLDLGFRASSKFPLVPHVKNRSRNQYAVVEACLALEQPAQALRYAASIENWRRGLGYADYAFYAAQNGHAQEASHYLDLASHEALRGEQDEDTQGWRTDRIRVRMAQAHVLLGQDERASQLEEDFVESELGKVEATRAKHVSPEEFAGSIASLDQNVVTGSLDQVQNALVACVALFDRFHADQGRRLQVLEAIRKAKGKVPAQVYIQTLMDLCEAALAHGDRETALVLAGEARTIVDGEDWLPRDQVPLMAELAALRHRAGEQAGALARLAQAQDLYTASRSEMIDIHRAGALRPVAEAQLAMGHTEASLETYRQVLEEGTANPNARPRADDLVATCISMARLDLEPDADMRARMYQILDGLSDPW